MDKENYLVDPRFKEIEPFENKVWLSSPTMHEDEQRWVDEAIRTNWVSTVGENINEVECMVVEKVGRKYKVKKQIRKEWCEKYQRRSISKVYAKVEWIK